ncbi:helix-turn-helix domain-containing protein [Streptomyces johnsoniae]|uniref:Helix-turn-helix transcriptional regulator n=1 Tax=Streptomyces johnsoniae TaxID=3075532 RepID=A0ABU2S3U8_9ACTN|nr:helix-turn-helix transcriptional regulator [Streptomyces sp. DSM 41886]MDT0442499.1 helix-turn-helix transcriptional regulator [Streptomyces sp. DSM 41886]
MTTRPTGSTVPRRQLGRHLRELRMKARLTVRAAARRLEWSEPKLWRIETGQTSLRSLDAQAMCMIYGASPEMTEALMGLAKETKARGWWHAYGDVIPEHFDVYIGLEEAAARIDLYHGDVVPGLLQTEEYAREIIRTHVRDVDDDDLDRRVELRLERQVLLNRVTYPPSLHIALGESVLRRPVGGHGAMSRQLAHLIYVSELPNLEIRVVPFTAAAHPGLVTGPFNVLRFPLNGDGAETEPPTVYSDGYTGSLYLDKPTEVQKYDDAFAEIWRASLDEQASRRLMADVAGSYEQHD